MKKDKVFSVFGMPVIIRDYAPDDRITLITKKGTSLTVRNETTGSETIYETPAHMTYIMLKPKKQQKGKS